MRPWTDADDWLRQREVEANATLWVGRAARLLSWICFFLLGFWARGCS
jgi:hypothetical protein